MAFRQKIFYNIIKRNYNNTSRIPLISLNNDIKNIDNISKCLNDTAFMYINNDIMNRDDINQLILLSKKFFKEWPLYIKESCDASKIAFRGYYIYEAQQNESDKIECFSIGKETNNPQELRQEYFESIKLPKNLYIDYISQKNKWPILKNNETDKELINDVHIFKELLLQYYDSCVLLSDIILELIAQSLNIDKHFFKEFHNLHDYTLEIKYYPEISETNFDINNERLKTHADLSTLTLLIQDEQSGLQIFDNINKSWINAPYNINSNDNISQILCNTGRFMEIWTNNQYKSTLHRVMPQTNSERISIVFFVFPNHSANIKTINSCLNPNQNPFQTICGHELPCVF